LALPQRERNLLRAVRHLAGPRESLDSTVALLLGKADGSPSAGRFASRLNNDGSPLQLCLTLSRDGHVLRLLADPASDVRAVEDRHRHAVDVVKTLVAASGDALWPTIRSSLAANLPPNLTTEPALAAGTLWVGVRIGGSGLALYVNARWGTVEAQWRRVKRWLGGLAPSHPTTAKGLNRLPELCEVASVGLEGLDVDRLRLKVYFRLAGRHSLSGLGIDLLRSQRITRFLDSVMVSRGIPASGIVFSFGVSAATGELTDAKVDVCGHCLEPRAGGLEHLLATCSHATDVPPFDLSGIGLGELVDVAFLGCGVGADESARLNLYLKGVGAH
jgi:hypothetical protein